MCGERQLRGDAGVISLPGAMYRRSFDKGSFFFLAGLLSKRGQEGAFIEGRHEGSQLGTLEVCGGKG